MNHHPTNNNDDNNNVVDPEMEGYKWSLAAFRRWLARREGKM
jgi:predicted double-glycine peptidase